MTRAARASWVASSRATTHPSGLGPSAASWTRICRPATSNSRSAIPAAPAARNAATASHTGSQTGAAVRRNRSPGSSAVPSSSSARGLAMVTRRSESTATTPVATFASTCAVRRRASSSAPWLRRTSEAMRSNAESTGVNSSGAPGGNAGTETPRPTATAASRSAATGRASVPAASPASTTAATTPTRIASTSTYARSSCCWRTRSSSSSCGTARVPNVVGGPGATTRYPTRTGRPAARSSVVTSNSSSSANRRNTRGASNGSTRPSSASTGALAPISRPPR